jgi:proteasome activator subunit 4
MKIRSGKYSSQLKQIMEQLSKWKAERPHGPKAVQSEHDSAAMTSEWTVNQADAALAWLTIELSDVHAAAAFPYIISIL